LAVMPNKMQKRKSVRKTTKATVYSKNVYDFLKYRKKKKKKTYYFAISF
jgi:hypothetical protein